jgi:hypothetical protein
MTAMIDQRPVTRSLSAAAAQTAYRTSAATVETNVMKT